MEKVLPAKICLMHTADLHLSTKHRAYSLAVLKEMVDVFQQKKADGWLFCGDLFDTFQDVEHLAQTFARYLVPLQGKALCFIAGNHELLGAPGDSDDEKRNAVQRALAPLAKVGIQYATALGHTPFVWSQLGLEAFAIPFQQDLSFLWGLSPSPKEHTWRVGLFHGALQGLNYTGQSEEEQHAVIDPAILNHLNLDYGALGHIHRGGHILHGNCLAHQPGSPRIWRSGEGGKRCVSLVHLQSDALPQLERIPLTTAGRWVRMPVTLQNNRLLNAYQEPVLVAQYLEELSGHYTPHDWLELHLEGMVERRTQAEEIGRQLEHAAQTIAKNCFRHFTVRLSDEALLETATLHQQPLARAFTLQWQKRMADLQEEAKEQGVVLNAHTQGFSSAENEAQTPYVEQLRRLHQAKRLFMEILNRQLPP